MREPGDDDDMVPLGEALRVLSDARRFGLVGAPEPIESRRPSMTSTMRALENAGRDLRERRAKWADEIRVAEDFGDDTRGLRECLALADDNLAAMRDLWRTLPMGDDR